MRLRVQVVIEPDDDEPNGDRQSAVVHDVASIERDRLTVDTLGCSWLKPSYCCSASRKFSSTSRCEAA